MIFFKLIATSVAIRELVAATVLTKNGPVTGTHVPMDMSLNAAIVQPVDAYLGIPFAQPPVGAFRFQPPQPIVNNWSETLLAADQPPACVTNHGGQEDCLYLNVFAPSTSSPKPRAVMIWIYGGGFKFGSISNFDGSPLASSEDVIVVMGNYRLGVLGFLANDATFAESGTTGNWGLMDQQAVMKWVQDNISAFGGDPDRVTIFGESAGAMSVIAHLANSESVSLFSNAIVQSGTSKVEMFFQPMEDAKKFNQWFTSTHLHCPKGVEDMECLRRVPASRFSVADTEREGWSSPTWSNPIFPLFQSGPVIDGVFLKDSPHAVLAADQSPREKKSIIVGTTQDEGTVFATRLHTCVRPEPQFPPLESELRDVVYYMTQDDRVTDRLMSEYPKYKSHYPSVSDFRRSEFQFVSDLIRDVMFSCPTTDLAESLSAAGHRVYMYNFAFNFWPESVKGVSLGSMVTSLGKMEVTDFGAYHSSDVPFVMKQFMNRNMTIADLTAESTHAIYMAPAFTQPGDVRHQVSDGMGCLWSNIAKCDTPNCAPCGAIPEWTQYDTTTRAFLLIDTAGDFKIDTVQTTGEMMIGASFPPMDTCKWYMENIHTPFHDIRADLGLQDETLQFNVADNKGALTILLSAAIMLVVV